MSKESKIALLVGLGFIITYGVILSEARNDKVPGDSGNVAINIDSRSVRVPQPLTVPIPQVHGNGRNQARVGNVRLQAEEFARQRDNAIARQNDSASQQTVQPRVRYYIVEGGDNLTRIAKKFYGPDGAARYLDIFNANTNQLANPDSLKVGMKLVIPQ